MIARTRNSSLYLPAVAFLIIGCIATISFTVR